MDKLKDRLKSAGSPRRGKRQQVALIASVTPDLTAKLKAEARQLRRTEVGGKGGGRPDMKAGRRHRIPATCLRCSRSKADYGAYKFCPRCAVREPGEYGAARSAPVQLRIRALGQSAAGVAAIVEHEGSVILALNKAWADPKSSA
jgi:hypothetical protein